MPPPPPIVRDEDFAKFAAWLRDTLEVGAYHLDVASDFTPQLAIEGAWVFQMGNKVFTIWKTQ